MAWQVACVVLPLYFLCDIFWVFLQGAPSVMDQACTCCLAWPSARRAHVHAIYHAAALQRCTPGHRHISPRAEPLGRAKGTVAFACPTYSCPRLGICL